jgi:hypothetical protein
MACTTRTHKERISASSLQWKGTRFLSQSNKSSQQKNARSLYASLGYPSMKDFKWILQSNQIKDSPVSVVDAEVILKIRGPNIAALKGKTTHSKPEVVVMDIVRIPKEIREVHKIISMSIDIFFINQIPFFITLSWNICFTMVTHLANRKLVNIFKAFKGIYVYYLQRGFQITTVTGDGEFEPMQELMNKLSGTPRLNLASANEHEPYIEQKI